MKSVDQLGRNFLYQEAHLQIMSSVRKFCEKEVNSNASEWEAQGIFPGHEIFKKMGALGFLGITKPESAGGLGLDYSHQLAFCEALGESTSPSLSLAVGVQTDMATPALAKYGSEDLIDEFLRPSIEGERIACLGASEPSAGSDLAGVSTFARDHGGDYIINGSKMWTTNGAQADWMCLLCNTSDGSPYLNKALLCLPLDLPGITRSRSFDKLGMRASDTVQVFFDDVKISKSNVIGSHRRGLLYQMEAFQEERLWIAASSLGFIERMINETIEYASARHVFGRRVSDNQYVQFTLAELHSELECLRSMIYRAVSGYVAGDNVSELICICKLKAGRLQRRVADQCIQFYGGSGFMNETRISQFYKDCRLSSIGGGADEIMLMMISRSLGMSGREQAEL